MEQSKFYQIKNVTEYEYTLVGCDGSVITRPIRDIDKSASAFTIQDAKDGDAVVDKSDGAIGIFQSIGHHPDGGSYNDPSYCFLHCHCDDEFFYADFEHGNEIDSDDLVPATKEQRDLLFSKMKEAGYEWDADKKELKKIEQKPAEWSEDDENRLNHIIQYLEDKDRWKDTERAFPIEEDVRWLKSLRPHKQWKPSEKHLIQLSNASNGLYYNCETLLSLLEQLKKLREE